MAAKPEDDIDRAWFSADLTPRPGSDDEDLTAPPRARAPDFRPEAWDRLVETLAGYEREIAATVDPRRRAALCFEVGRIYETRLRDDRRAIAYYQRAFRCDPQHVATLRATRGIFARAGKWAMVLRLLDAEIRTVPEAAARARLLVEKGDVYLTRFDRPDAARRSFAAALELVPADRAAARGLGHAATLLGDASLAAEALERAAAAAEDPQIRAGLLIDAAVLRLERAPGDERAESLLRAVLRAAPDHVEAQELLARAWRRAGRWRELTDLRQDLAERQAPGPDRAAVFAGLARLRLEQLGDAAGATECLERAVADDPRSAVALHMLAELQERRGDVPAAVATLSRLVALSADPQMRAGLRWRQAELLPDDATAVVPVLQALLDDDPTWPAALERLGRLLDGAGRWAELAAMHRAELARVDDPRRRGALLLRLGELLETRLGDAAAARAAYAEAVELQPGVLPASRALARVLQELGDWESYVSLLEDDAARARNPRQRATLLERAAECVATRLAQPVRAMALWRQVLALRPDDVEAIRSIARLAARSGDRATLVEMNDAEIELGGEQAHLVALLVRNAGLCDDEPERARGYFERALELDAGDGPALRGLGRLLAAQGDWPGLVALHGRELELATSPDEGARLHFRIGVIRRDRLRDVDGAVQAFERALELVPDHLPTLRALGHALARRGDAAREAEILAVEATCVGDPRERAALLYRLGELYQFRLGQLELATEAFERVLELQPGFTPALAALVAVHERRGDDHDLAAAWRRMARAAATASQAIEAWLQVARLCGERIGIAVEAIEAYEAVLALDPGHVGALLGLERMLVTTRSLDRLAGVYRRLAEAVASPSARADYLVEQARLLEAHLDAPARAFEAYRRALELDPSRTEVLERLEALAGAVGDTAALVDVLGRRLETTDEPRDRVGILLRRGDLFRESDRPREAVLCYEEAARLDPTSLPAVRGLRELYAGLGRGDEALRMAEREGGVVEDASAASGLLVAAGRVREDRLRDVDGALEDYRRALHRNPADEEALASLRRLCERAGRWQALVDALEALASALPASQADLRMEAARVCVDRLDDPQRAAALLGHVVASLAVQSPVALQRLADLYTDLEAWADAATVYERLREISTDRSMRVAVGYRLAAIYTDKQPSLERARACLDAVIADAPGDVEALSRRASLEEGGGDARLAIECLERAVALEPRAGLLRRLAQLRDEPDAWSALLRVAPGDLEGATRLAAHLPDAQAVSDLLRRTLAEVKDEVEAQRLRMRFAELLIERGAAAEAEALVRHVIDASPSDPAPRALLARACEALEDGLDRAVAAVRWLLDRDPFAVEPLRALRRLDEAAGRPDRAFQIALLIHALREAGPEERRVIERWRDRVGRWPRQPLDEALRLSVRSPREVPMFDDALAGVSRALPRLFAAPPSVPVRESLSEETEALAARVAGLVGVEGARVQGDLTLGAGVRALDGPPPTVVFGAEALSRLGAGERTFHLARGFHLGRRRLAGVVAWSPDALRGLLEALVTIDGPGEPEPRARTLVATLDRRARQKLGTVLPDLRHLLPDLDLAAALEGFVETANRIGVLLCGGVVPALDALRKSARDAAAPLAEVPGAADVARFVAGDACLEARRALGLAAVDG